MLAYIVIFCVVFIFGTICLYTSKNGTLNYNAAPKGYRERIFILVTFLIMLFFQGLRSFEVGADTKAYIDIFDLIVSEEDSINIFMADYLDIEIGYIYLNLFIAKLSTNHRFFLIVISSIMLMMHMNFLRKNSKNMFMSFVLFIGFGHFFTSMSSLRQYLALAIVLWTLPFIVKKKYMRTLIFSIIAFLFHNSVIVFFVPLIIGYIFRKRRNFWIPTLVILLISLPFTMIILDQFLRIVPKYSYYNNAKIVGVGQLKIAIDIIYFMLLIYILKNKRIQTDSINIYTIFLCFAIYTSFLGQYLAYAFRLSYYFDYILLLLIPELISLSNRHSKLLRRCFYILSFALFIYLLATNAAAMVPWKFM